MTFQKAFFILIAGILVPASAFSPEDLRNYFEWGEYRQLIDTLEPYLADHATQLDSTVCARYHLYLGVAKYGTGQVGEARKCFLRALRYDPLQRPDRQYISEAIDNLFTVTLSDYTEEQRRKRRNDSLLVQQQRAFEKNVHALQLEERSRSRRTGTILSISTATVGAALAGIALYEYYSTRESYSDFQAAAADGDRLTYDRLRPVIRRANGIIVGCAVTTGISELASLFLGIRAGMQRVTTGEKK